MSSNKYCRRKNFDAASFCSDRTTLISNVLDTFDNPESDDLLEIWQSHFISVLNENAPLVSKKVRSKCFPGSKCFS